MGMVRMGVAEVEVRSGATIPKAAFSNHRVAMSCQKARVNAQASGVNGVRSSFAVDMCVQLVLDVCVREPR